MRAIFLADAHLHHPDDANYRLLLQFLDEQRGRTDLLCILGDLFDFRVGLPSLDFPEHEPMLAALAALSRSGTRLVYLEGNHDFHLGAAFAARIGCELHRGPVVLEVGGMRLHLCHGDLVNRADWRYRLLHLLLRNPVTPLVAGLAPTGLLHRIRGRLQRTSRNRYRHDRVRWDYTAIIRAFAAAIRDGGCDALVLGHFHQPFLEERDGFTLLSLGDWIGHFSYGQLENGSFSLSSYASSPRPSVPTSSPAAPAPPHP